MKTKKPVHELTLQPGGRTLQLKFQNGEEQVQPRVKYPSKYIKRVLEDETRALIEVSDITDRNSVKVIWKSEGSSPSRQLNLF